MSGYRDLHHTTPPSSISPHVGRSHPRKTSGGVLLRAVCGFFFSLSFAKRRGAGGLVPHKAGRGGFSPASERERERQRRKTTGHYCSALPTGKKNQRQSFTLFTLSHPLFICLIYRSPKNSLSHFPRSLTATSHHAVLYSVGKPANQIIRFPEARSRLVAPSDYAWCCTCQMGA